MQQSSCSSQQPHPSLQWWLCVWPGAAECGVCSGRKEGISIFHLRRWWRKFGLCCGTWANGLQTGCWLEMRIVDGCHFSSLEEMGEEMSLEKMNNLDGCHSFSLQEVGGASLEKMVIPVNMWLLIMYLELVLALSRNNSRNQQAYRVSVCSVIWFFLF